MIHRSLRKPRRALAPALLTVLALAGCGSSHSSSSQPKTASAPAATATAPSTTATAPSRKTSNRHRSSSKRTVRTTRPSTAVTLAPASRAYPAQKAPTPLPNANPAPEPGCPRGVVPCVTKSTTVKPVGSSYIDLNLEEAMARNQPQLSHVNVSCPASTAYPVPCRMAGFAKIHGKTERVTGTVTVLGVETSTRSYAYSLEYSPAKSG